MDVEHTAEGLRFTLRPESEQRLARIHGPDWSAPRLIVSHDNREALEGVYGGIYKNFVPILTDLDLERAATLGGMRFHDANTGAVLAEWPRR